MRYRKDSFIRWYFKERSLSSIDSIRPTTQSLRDKAVEFGYEIRELSVNGVKEHRIRWSQSGEWLTIPDFITNHRSMIARRAQSEINRLDGLYPGAESEKKPELLVEFHSGSQQAYNKVKEELNRTRRELQAARKDSESHLNRLNKFFQAIEAVAKYGGIKPLGRLLADLGLLEEYEKNRKQRARMKSR